MIGGFLNKLLRFGLFFGFFLLTHITQWVGLCGRAQVLIVYMSVNLSGIQVVVTQNLLKRSYIHTILKH